MPTESEYGDDIRLLDDLTRLKLKLIDKKLKPNPSPRYYGRRAYTPDDSPAPPLPPERRRDRFYRRIDRRNELLQKLWEELGNGPPPRRYPVSLPPLTPREHFRKEDCYLPWMDDQLYQRTGNTKKDLMELMLIQNAQVQQWMMTQTLQKQQGNNDGNVHHHYYDAAGRQLPPIRRADAGNQYPQDFFSNDNNSSPNTREGRDTGTSPQKNKSRRRNRRN